MREMNPFFRPIRLKCDERRFCITLEYNSEMILIFLALRDPAGHIVVQPHNNFMETDPVSLFISAVIQITVQVIRTPLHEFLLKVIKPRLNLFVRCRDVHLLIQCNHPLFRPSKISDSVVSRCLYLLDKANFIISPCRESFHKNSWSTNSASQMPSIPALYS